MLYILIILFYCIHCSMHIGVCLLVWFRWYWLIFIRALNHINGFHSVLTWPMLHPGWCVVIGWMYVYISLFCGLNTDTLVTKAEQQPNQLLKSRFCDGARKTTTNRKKKTLTREPGSYTMQPTSQR
nr:MAG TPA: hypothetical protein [Caudoviricetes sp.]